MTQTHASNRVRDWRQRSRIARLIFADPHRFLLDWRGSPERPLLPALLLFTAGLAVWAALMALAGWRQTPIETSGSVAFTLAPSDINRLNQFETEALDATQGVLSWRLVPAEELAATLAELAPNAIEDLPPLPHLYEVEVDQSFDALGFIGTWQETLPALRYQTLKAPPERPIKPLPWPWLLVLMADLILALGVTTMSLSMSLRIQAESLAILHQLGASDELIASHFRGHLLRLALRPLVLGALLGLLAFWLWGRARDLRGEPFLLFETWYSLLALGLSFAFLTGLLVAGHRAVLGGLRARY